MKNQTAQIQMACIIKLLRIFLFLMMTLFVKGSLAQTGEAWINNTDNASGSQAVTSSAGQNFINLQTGDNSSASKNAVSYLWTLPTGVTILSAQGTNTITEGTGIITPLAGAPSYTWTFGSGRSTISGQDTTSIVVSPDNLNNWTKCTKNSCGSSAAATLTGREVIKQ